MVKFLHFEPLGDGENMGGRVKRAGGGATKVKTMEQFAAVVGLSRPTVSKFFDDPKSVRTSTRARIEATLKDLNFRPNIFAVNLNRRRKKIIGLIVPDPMDHFYMALTCRIEAIANQAGYFVLQLNSNGRPELEERSIATIASMNVGGAIIAPLGIKSHAAKLKALGRKTPLVFVDAPLGASEAFVGTNNHQSMPLIAEYLCRSGAAPVYFDMPAVNFNAVERRKAYAATLERLGLRPTFVELGVTDQWNFEAITYEVARATLRGPGFPSRTILCANDRVAFGVIAAINESGASVGAAPGCDYRVAGHDNQPLSAYTSPPLTTVAQDTERMSQLAFDMLVGRMEDADGAARARSNPNHVLLNGELVLRKSA
jgi:DNA-binding LacI/PurR family transcriptional regulator